MTRIIGSFATCAILIAFAPTAWSAVTWQKMQANGDPPMGAVLGGVDQASGVNNGVPLYVCHAQFGGTNDVHPGKEIANQCNIGYGGKEVERTPFEVAVGPGTWDKRGTDGALVGGQENGGPLYVCRVRYNAFDRPVNWDGVVSHLKDLQININDRDRGWHPGKLLADKHCHFGYGGKEHDSTDYELFYPQ